MNPDHSPKTPESGEFEQDSQRFSAHLFEKFVKESDRFKFIVNKN